MPTAHAKPGQASLGKYCLCNADFLLKNHPAHYNMEMGIGICIRCYNAFLL